VLHVTRYSFDHSCFQLHPVYVSLPPVHLCTLYICFLPHPVAVSLLLLDEAHLQYADDRRRSSDVSSRRDRRGLSGWYLSD